MTDVINVAILQIFNEDLPETELRWEVKPQQLDLVNRHYQEDSSERRKTSKNLTIN